jgi:hypothetical protein
MAMRNTNIEIVRSLVYSCTWVDPFLFLDDFLRDAIPNMASERDVVKNS